ncbi:MAG: M56 family metallopeptidase [Rhodococcus sp.]|uniref:M56 family metallopeptidase n=1 Tax=Rhodococcus TaxID=1827 RepID=UPI0016A02E15|nr:MULTISPECIES: M56 family metallopeptidase [Rhodococcus]NLV80071.1 M56 family metallopeptidase [Rhodococcus sp. (in: high G+C Gram-positive bacteria)]
MNATTALVFGILALLLAGPMPRLLARATWPHRNPRAALVLWQAIALAAVLSAFSCGLAIAARLLVPGPDGRPTTGPLDEIDALGLPLWLIYIIVFALTLFVGARLIFSTIRVGIRTRRRRSRHRMLVDLLDRRDIHGAVRHLPHVRILDNADPIAYCLPGIRHRVVLSEGTIGSLTDDELRAVLRHEHSHLRARHDLILEAFTAVYEAFPRWVRSRSALGSVQLLVEMLADDSAVRATGPTHLARALVTCAGSPTPTGALAVGGPSTLLRVRRLSGPGPDLTVSACAYIAAAAILVVPTVAVAVPWLTELTLLFSH